MSFRLIDLSVGQAFKFEDLSHNSDVFFKLLSLGILKGDQAQVIGRAPFGGPISLKHGESNFLALRRSEAAEIIVSKVASHA